MTPLVPTRIKRLLAGCVLAFAALNGNVAMAASACGTADWPLWDDFRSYFIQDSGRVLDASTPMSHSSSEGQSYGMFFALVAGDRSTFDRLWGWAVNNLGGGDLSQRLPAWIWGQAPDGAWGVIDDNSASDANLWFVYALLEAGRLWQEPVYTRHALDMLALVEAQEIADLPGLGYMLLPGKDWFSMPNEQAWQLNASYLPLPILRRLANERPQGPWGDIAENTAIMTEATAPHGFAPDWTRYQAKNNPPSFVVDTSKGAVGSYDAIRTYLWAGMTPSSDPLFARMLLALDGMVSATRDAGKGVPPESVNTQTGELTGQGPFGFSAALIPYFKAKGQELLLGQQKLRVRAMLHQSSSATAAGGQPPYYDYVLSLFGTGWLDGLFRFKADGTLYLSWGDECVVTTK